MNLDSLKTLNHHAYYLVGNEKTKDELLNILSLRFSFNKSGNPDFFEREYETFTIDDARELKLAHEMRPVSNDGKKVFIIFTQNFTIEAQNALLKLLEEPKEYALFFLIIPSQHILLSTVKSRLAFISQALTNQDDEGNDEASKFIKASKAKRLEIIKKLIDDIGKDKKTKKDAIDFVNSIEREIYNTGKIKDNMKALKAIEMIRKYLNDRAPSLKMLLEYVALTI